MTPARIETRAIQLERRYERLLRQRYRESYKRMSGWVADLMGRLSEVTFSEAVKYNRYDKLMSQINKELNELKREEARIVERAKFNLYQNSAKDNAEALLQEARRIGYKKARTAGSFTFLDKNRLLEAIATPYESLALRRNYRNALSDIEGVLTSGLVEGKSYPQMARELRDRIGVSYSKANRILRTEGNTAVNRGIKDANNRVRALGISISEVWVSAMLTDRSRETHMALNGKPKNEEHDGWYLGGVWAKHPGDSQLPAKHRVNCMCRIITKVLKPQSN